VPDNNGAEDSGGSIGDSYFVVTGGNSSPFFGQVEGRSITERYRN